MTGVASFTYEAAFSSASKVLLSTTLIAFVLDFWVLIFFSTSLSFSNLIVFVFVVIFMRGAILCLPTITTRIAWDGRGNLAVGDGTGQGPELIVL